MSVFKERHIRLVVHHTVNKELFALRLLGIESFKKVDD